MRGYVQLTISQLRIFARNRQVMFWTLFFPLFMMIVLGSFLSDGGGAGAQITVVDQDQSRASMNIIDTLREIDAVKLDTMDHQKDALAKLKDGDTDLVVIISKGTAEALQQASDTPAKLTTYYDETRMIQTQIGMAILDQVIDGISKSMQQYEPTLVLEKKGVQSAHLEYIDFLVPGILAMMIMSTNLNGVAGQIASWRERGVLRRMQSTPLKPQTFIAAQITARLVLNGLQAIIVLVVAWAIFHTQVNGSFALLLLFIALGTLSFMAIGFIIAGLAKTPESAAPIASFLSFPLMFLGGVFFPVKSMPEFLQPIVKTLPITQLSGAMRQIMNLGDGLTVVWTDALYLSIWMIGAFIIASFVFKWE